MNPTAYPSGGERGLREDSRAYHGGLCLVLHNMMLAKNTPPRGRRACQAQGHHKLGIRESVEAAGGGLLIVIVISLLISPRIAGALTGQQ